ncbi:hypothetical protein ASE63_25185 [Bosea sp. Root381]|uniref:hypothetical protein n=1 Tax=Bosea sp. Root381 TaxID=1736524 RepID=UPI0006F3EBB8|nr:hypothetical protein [Bosea sp. Root381]KRE05059.1 hypothetical protein ASE63_25185 [Bosea sp. Root381]
MAKFQALLRAKKDKMRELNEQAKLAASNYAPPPEGLAATYGLISTALASIILWGLARFYDIALISHPAFVGISLVLALAFGVWLRYKRKRQHRRACNAERVRLIGRREESMLTGAGATSSAGT